MDIHQQAAKPLRNVSLALPSLAEFTLFQAVDDCKFAANDLFMQDHIMSFTSPAHFDPFFQRGDGLIDIRLFVIALSTVHRPSQAMETLKLAFKVSTLTIQSQFKYVFYECV